MGRVTKETFSGMKWMLLQKCTLQPLQLVFAMFLARLITPAEMGILGLTGIFFAIAAALAGCGFGSALIRKQDRTEADINTMFWFNAGMSLLMGLILYLCAPFFVNFFNQPALLWLTRASAVMMFLNSLGSVHWTLYSARRDFKTPAIVHTIIAIVSMPICLILAYIGWGYWALMAQSIFSGLAALIVIWILSPWKPKFIFSVNSFKEMFAYGSKLALSGLLDSGSMHIRNLIIGRFYTPADLAFYDRGRHLAGVFPMTVCSMLGGVTFPILATLQDQPERLRTIYRKYLRLFTLSITWICLCAAAYAKPFVAVMYGNQWENAVIFCQLLCFTFSIYHLQVINLNLLQVMGRSDLFLRLEVIKKVLGLSIMFYCATISVVAMCIGSMICSYICLYLNSFFTKRLINLGILQQLGDYAPLFLLALATTWGPALFIVHLPLPPVAQLLIGGFTSLILYLFILRVTHNESLNETLRIIEAQLPQGKIKKLCAKYVTQPEKSDV